ncbi:MAG: copper amine oxidase N-terminal domain-containing protein [Syntrophomonadaceae bacterium]|nr:copper amine oxidase N-terminal domain-containing protein [Syntrophomonadaceae bacterium]
MNLWHKREGSASAIIGMLTVMLVMMLFALAFDTADVVPEAPGGVTMVPLRGVLDFFGADLNYDGVSQDVTVKDKNIIVKLLMGENTALVNERQVKLLRPAEIKNGRTLIPQHQRCSLPGVR